MKLVMKANPTFVYYSDGEESLLVEQKMGRLSGQRIRGTPCKPFHHCAKVRFQGTESGP